MTHHVSQADVEEHPSCDGKDDVGREGASEQDAQDQAHVAGQGRHQVEEDGLRDAHPGVQQDDKVTCRRTHSSSNRPQTHVGVGVVGGWWWWGTRATKCLHFHLNTGFSPSGYRGLCFD